MSSHTPGPWKVKHGYNVLAESRTVATCGGYTSNLPEDNSHEVNIANAKLIAAAPELLNALESFVWLHDSTDRRLCEDAGVEPNANGCDCDLCLRAKPIIAAAKGVTK